MISTFTAFFDSNVFYGARLRSLVLHVAGTKLFRARWSARVHDEWIGNLLANRPDLRAEDLGRTRTQMNAAVPDCLVEGYERFLSAITLPDPDDRHVVAAAFKASASVIVTFNLRDFPDEAIAPFHLHTRHPDDFLCEAFSLAPPIFAGAVRSDFLHYRNPPLLYVDYIEALAMAGVPRLAKELAPLAILME